MGGLDPTKIFLILVVALVVLGPERLPGAARQLGGMWRELNRLRVKFDEEVHSVVPDLDLPKIPRNPSQAVGSYLTGLVTGTASFSGTGTVDKGDPEDTGDPDVVSQDLSSEALDESLVTSNADASPRSHWRPLLGNEGLLTGSAVPAVPLSGSEGPLRADTVFVFDEPSMN